MKTRIYLVTIRQDAAILAQRLIRASSRATAVRWASRDFIEAHVPAQDELVDRLTAGGLRVEEAREDTETLDLFLGES